MQIADFWDLIPEECPYKSKPNPSDEFFWIHTYLKEKCEIQTEEEGTFLDMYFSIWLSHYGYLGEAITTSSFLFSPLIPLPQAHLYLPDRYDEEIHMHKVDFAFWTGKKFIAVEIHGDGKPIGEFMNRDRRFKNAGVEVTHILNSDLKNFDRVMDLLPNELKSESFVEKFPKRYQSCFVYSKQDTIPDFDDIPF